MSEDSRSAYIARIADLLEAVRASPTGELRALLAEARWRARGDRELRMLFAEHYRAIGAPDQAARYGIVEPGWVSASEQRAMRLGLLSLVASGRGRDWLQLRGRDPVPPGLEDLVDVPERAARDGGILRRFAVIAWLVGCVWWCVSVGRAIIDTADGAALWDAMRAVRLEALVSGILWLAGHLWLRRERRRRGDWHRRWQRRVERRAHAVLPLLSLHGERHALLRGWLHQTETSELQEPVRRLLVDLARERRRPAEAGRWGIAVDGITTPAERAAFAATLGGGELWMRELERRTGRSPGRLGVDERDALLRAGVPADAIDRRWMTAADRLTEQEHARVARVLAALATEPTEALRSERRSIVRGAQCAPHPEVRRLLASHYRAVGQPGQAGRWGVADPGWATAAEVRALRLDLLEQRPTHPTRTYIGLAREEPLPAAIADLERSGVPSEHPLELVGATFAIVGVLAFFAGVGHLLFAGALALRDIEQPLWLWLTIIGCGSTVLIAGGTSWGSFAAADRIMAPRPSRDPYARELRRRLPRLPDPAERRSLAIGALASREARTRRAARSILVESSKSMGRADEVARWGASLGGVTTVVERAAWAARLAGAPDPLRMLVSRSHREPGPLSADERDVLRRAGVARRAMDAFDAER